MHKSDPGAGCAIIAIILAVGLAVAIAIAKGIVWLRLAFGDLL